MSRPTRQAQCPASWRCLLFERLTFSDDTADSVSLIEIVTIVLLLTFALLLSRQLEPTWV